METKDITQLFEGELMKRFERVLSIFLSCTLLLGLLPAMSFAEEGDSDDSTDEAASLEDETQSSAYSGAGTAENPYEISTAEQLTILATEVNDGETYEGKYVKLTADIDLSRVCGTNIGGNEVSWMPIGDEVHPFKGTFDGGGKRITDVYINYIEKDSSEHYGLFGYLDTGGTIKNLGIVDGTVNGYYIVGGVCGKNYGTIVNCYNGCSIVGTSWVGGISGSSYGTIENCYNTGAVSGGFAGGICGSSVNPNDGEGSVKNCYSTGAVSNGGVTYNNPIKPDGSNVGGVCGFSGCSVTNCYFLETDTVNNSLSAVGDGSVDFTSCAGKTEEDFATESTFTSWDFAEGTGVWKMDEILGRPVLRSVPEPYFDGAGTEADPYLIPDLTKLEVLSRYVGQGYGSGEYFLLTADIDMSEKYGEDIGSWTPIGNYSTKFKGTFDGNGKEIKNLYINNTSSNPINDAACHYRGLFGCLDSGGTIKNLSVSGKVYATRWSGGICGESEPGSFILNCCSSVDVSLPANETYSESLGGICGSNKGTITNCYNTGNITGYQFTGGACGHNSGTISNCYSTGNVVSTNGGSTAGGICGRSVATIDNCFYLQTDNICSSLNAVYDGGGTSQNCESKTSEQFSSGEVAYLLQAAQSVPEGSDTAPQVWGQAIETDDYPVLTADPAKAIYKVTFNSDGVEYAVKYGNQTGLAALPDAPTKNGYTFNKWLTADGATAFTTSTPLSANIEVWATWTQNSTEGDDSSGSSSSSSGSESGGDSSSTPTTPPPPQIGEPKVYKLAVEPSTLELDNVNSTATLTVTLTEDGEPVDPPTVTWESSNEAVATVDENGLVSAAAKGEATITATYTGKTNTPLTATCAVTVSNPVTKLTLDQTALALHPEETAQLTATAEGAFAGEVDEGTITWESSNETVATVDENGLVTAVAAGEATITATFADTADTAPLSATCEVVVNAEEPPSEKPGDQPSDDPNTDTPDIPTDPSDEPGTDTPSGDEPSVEPDEPSVEPTEPTEPVEEPSDDPNTDTPGEPADPGESPSDEPTNPAVETLAIYRLYNPNSGEHFYTASEFERDCVKAAGWIYEGIGWTAPIKSNTPVYRLYSGTDHHFTKDANEKAWLEAQGWTYEGISFYSANDTGTPLYRLFNPNVDPSAASNNSGSHNYTTNKAENDFLVSIGWQAEGVAWYGV